MAVGFAGLYRPRDHLSLPCRTAKKYRGVGAGDLLDLFINLAYQLELSIKLPKSYFPLAPAMMCIFFI
jgi:hypothetical protein